MEEIRFNTLQELYNRLLPALRSKVKELNNNKINFIKEEDIWNCLKTRKWKDSKVLNLSDMVDDILNTENIFFIDYINEVLKNRKTTLNLEEKEI